MDLQASQFERAKKANSAEDPTRGALLIKQHALCNIDEKICPICLESYSDSSDQESQIDREIPVSVDMIAEWFGSKQCCGHIIGRKCLDRYLHAAGEWSNKCPICRDIWFHKYLPDNIEAAGEEHARTSPQQVSFAQSLRRSQRIAERVAAQQDGRRTHRSDLVGTRRNYRVHHSRSQPPRFFEDLLVALEVTDGSSAIFGTLEDVERRLGTLYSTL